jgi:hypothetical protein
MVIAVLLLPVAVLTGGGVLHLTFVFNGLRIPDDISGVLHWSMWSQAVLVWARGVLLAAATLAYYRATRAWQPSR